MFIGGLPKDATEGDVIQLGLPFGRMTNMVLAKKRRQVHCSLICSYVSGVKCRHLTDKNVPSC